MCVTLSLIHISKQSATTHTAYIQTCIICDTKGLHKEGKAKKEDRYSVIINYTLEEEYNGTRGRQKILKRDYMKLNSDQRVAARFLEVIGNK